MVAELTERLGLKMPPAVYVVDAAAQPFVWGWLQDSIYLPEQFTTGTREQRQKTSCPNEAVTFLTPLPFGGTPLLTRDSAFRGAPQPPHQRR